MTPLLRWTIALLPLAIATFSACSDPPKDAEKPDSSASLQDSGDAALPSDGASSDTSAATKPTCDAIDPSHCLLPYPSAFFLRDDATSPTGYRLDIGPNAMPKNADGKPIEPTAWNRADGFGVGWAALAAFPGVDISKLPSENKPDGCLDKDAAIVLLEVGKGGAVTRVPYFVELDADPDIDDDKERLLIVRPLVIPRESTRYVIGIRGLVDTAGKTFAPSDAFTALRDKKTDGTAHAPRQARFDEVFELLGKAGVARQGLQLAWDWVTASHQFLHGDMLHIRDEGLKTLGAKGPELTVTKVEAFTKLNATQPAGTRLRTPTRRGDRQRAARGSSRRPAA